MRVIVLLSLKPGVSPADYEVWARTCDMPTVRALSSIAGFDVWRATGLLGSDGAAPYDYIEIIDIADMDRFGTDVASTSMASVAQEFSALADAVFITTDLL